MSDSRKKKVAVVGAGLVGRLTALLIGQRFDDLAVSLLDMGGPEDEDSCSFVAAGLLTPDVEAALGEPKVGAMGRAALKLWPYLLRPDHDRIDRSYVVARPQDVADLMEFREKMLRRGAPKELSLLAQPDLSRQDSFFSGTKLQGFEIPNSGYVNPVALLHRLTAQLVIAGIQMRWNTRVEELSTGSIRIGGQREHFDFVFDTRGLGARDDLKDLRGVRGELIHIHSPEIKLKHAVKVLHPRFPVYIVPRGEDRYVIGATALESEVTGPPTVQSALELLGGIADLHHGFRQATIISLKSQLRPALPDNLPVVQVEPGLTRINGLYRHGILLAPLLAEMAVDQTFGEESIA